LIFLKNFIEFEFLLNYIFLVLLLLFSALISGSEVALFSLTKKQINENLKFSSFKIIDRLLSKPNKLLATILIVNNLINISIVILFSNIGNEIFEEISSPILKFIFEIIVATFLILFFGEILPKIYASRNNILFSKRISRLLNLLDFIFSPLSFPMQWFSNYINSRIRLRSSAININEISYALDLTESLSSNKDEKKLLKGIVSFSNNITKNIMQPRVDVLALEKQTLFKDVLLTISNKNHSRIPVYETNLDKIIGVLHVKDLLPYLNEKNYNWNTLLRKPFFVPENKKLDDLILDFQEKRIHLAIVVDEYGGTSGIVSLEDVIEEIVGDISDEFDDDQISYSKIDNHNFVFDGKTSISDVSRIIGVDHKIFDSHRGDAETIAGLILEVSYNFPKINNRFNFKNLIFKIESIDDKRLKKIKITLNK